MKAGDAAVQKTGVEKYIYMVGRERIPQRQRARLGPWNTD